MAKPNSLPPVAITAYSTVSSCGSGNHALLGFLQTNQTALAPLKLFDLPFPAFVGEITAPLPEISPSLHAYDCRNARVALAALDTTEDGVRAAVDMAKTKYGKHRIGTVIGTSTSGLNETEAAYAFFMRHNRMPDDFFFLTRHAYQATPRFLQKELGLSGPCYAVSTACSSSAKAIGCGQRLIASGVCDAVLVGGADSLCQLTLRGFKSLELLSPHRCQPMDSQRCGINIGEAAALLLIEKNSEDTLQYPQLLAVGESSDAYHMSSPHPEGIGAAMAMNSALQLAQLEATNIDYLNLHATATKINDQVESYAVMQALGGSVPCSGTKGITGHTLGAAGALETIIALLALQYQFIPGTAGLQRTDGDCRCRVITAPITNQRLSVAMSNSFGFGGNNASVIVSRHHE